PNSNNSLFQNKPVEMPTKILAAVLLITVTGICRPTLADPVEPVLTYETVCEPLSYNGLYLRHQLELPITLNMTSTSDFTLIDIDTKVDSALMALHHHKMRITVQPAFQPRLAALVFICPTFYRCQQLKESVASNPETVWRSIQFSLSAQIGNKINRYKNLRTANLPSIACDPGRWVVFQRRVDDSLSFAQDWDAYVNGFGSPGSNYWMGLDQLFKTTVTSANRDSPRTSRCRLRIEIEDFNGETYMGEYRMFQVLDPKQNYRLKVGNAVPDSDLTSWAGVHNEMQFSTYDRKHDRQAGTSCSHQHGYGGWWYESCHHMDLNGAYLTDRNITNSSADSKFYASVLHRSSYRPVKRTLMMLKCG
ncbi:hypothetical protein BOX15_Mlig002767g2, partial [Macrostomum lignano]